VIRVTHFFVIVFCAVLLCVCVPSSVLWCPHKTMFGLYLQLFVGGLMSYLCLFVHSSVQHILCCVFVLVLFVLCNLCCQFLWIVHFWILRCSPTFISPLSTFTQSDMFYVHTFRIIFTSSTWVLSSTFCSIVNFPVFFLRKNITRKLYILLVLCFFTPKKKYRSVWLLFSVNSAIVQLYHGRTS
jgi:hypothetical protein